MITDEDIAKIKEYGPAFPPDFPDCCALCRIDYSGIKRVGSPGGFLEIGDKDYWICTQCERRLGGSMPSSGRWPR